jgi:hypothetical protein
VPAADLTEEVVRLDLDRYRGEVDFEQDVGAAQRGHQLTVCDAGLDAERRPRRDTAYHRRDIEFAPT